MKVSTNQAMVPISACLLAGAAAGERPMFKRLSARALSIAVCGVQYWPCLHQPRCPEVTPAELAALVDAIPALQPLAEYLAAKRESEVAA